MSSLKNMILLVGLLLLSSMEIQAKSYNSWHLLYQDTYGVIKKVKDPKKKKTVIEFQSKTSRDTYINGAKTGKKAWNNKKDKTIKWDFNFPKSFVIMVSIKTKDGYRDLVYTSGDDNGNLYFGLGKHIISGTWQTITRNLENDLHKYEPNNEIISVNAFIIRGSGKIGKIEMLGFQKKETEAIALKVEPKVEVIIKKVEEKIKDILRKEQKDKEEEQEKKNKKPITKEATNHNSLVPKIILEEGSLIYHKLGEPFFEPGATATDYDGGTIDVDIIGEVDINKVNRYVLTYIATDENGHTTTKARVVMVHKAGEEVKVKRIKSKEVDVNETTASKITKEKMIQYEEFLDLTPLHGGGEIDEDLLYYD